MQDKNNLKFKVQDDLQSYQKNKTDNEIDDDSQDIAQWHVVVDNATRDDEALVCPVEIVAIKQWGVLHEALLNKDKIKLQLLILKVMIR